MNLVQVALLRQLREDPDAPEADQWRESVLLGGERHRRRAAECRLAPERTPSVTDLLVDCRRSADRHRRRFDAWERGDTGCARGHRRPCAPAAFHTAIITNTTIYCRLTLGRPLAGAWVSPSRWRSSSRRPMRRPSICASQKAETLLSAAAAGCPAGIRRHRGRRGVAPICGRRRYGGQLHLSSPEHGLSGHSQRRPAGRSAQEALLAHGRWSLSGCRSLCRGAGICIPVGSVVIGKPSESYFKPGARRSGASARAGRHDRR